MERNYGQEIDELKSQLNELQHFLTRRLGGSHSGNESGAGPAGSGVLSAVPNTDDEDQAGTIYYAGRYRGEQHSYRWEPQERQVRGLLDLDGDKAAKILAALGSKQRLDILRAVSGGPLTGAELVERLQMGTTGQLYHHVKPLLGANLLVQEERGGKYALPGQRALPLLLLLAAAADLLDTSGYIEMTAVRDNAGTYLGTAGNGFDPHLLVWSLLENTILEHRAGYCSEASIFLQADGSITVADNGRGIPTHALAEKEHRNVQAILTDIQHGSSASYFAPGGEKGISVAIVNALSSKLSVEIRRDGHVYRQDFKHGIPQTGMLVVGVTNETGTSVTLEPDRELFLAGFDRGTIQARADEIMAAYPGLQVRIF